MIKLYSYGKLNLFLDVVGKLDNGYHLIKSVMQSVSLFDEIHISETTDNKIIIKCDDPDIPTDNRNTCYKAAEIIKNNYNISYGVNISLNKRIPTEAGLAGGSSNCAAVIIGLNKLWNLNLTYEQLLEIGLKIGADVPFCLVGGTCLAEGIGEKLIRLNEFHWDNILIVKPSFSMPTSNVYDNMKPEYFNIHEQNNILSHIQDNDYMKTILSMANTLENAAEKMEPDIKSIKRSMYESGAVSALMTGSGSAIYGMFNDSKSLEKAYAMFKNKYFNIFKVRTMNSGVTILNS